MRKNLIKQYREKSRKLAIFLVAGLLLFGCEKQDKIRLVKSLNSDWLTVANDTNKLAFQGFHEKDFNTQNWQPVDVPHNWDDYGGYRRLRHGNRHGYAWYRKTFTVENANSAKRYFLFFEGVGSYATVWLNGDSIGYHAGGRTTFTLDATPYINFEGENLLAVRADHPSDIRDLPWVCGGCSPEWGFCEGSQPMGIFRPVHLVETAPVRVQPFGVHIWNDNTINTAEATLNLTTELKNYNNNPGKVTVKNILLDKTGKTIAVAETEVELEAGQSDTIKQTFEKIENPQLWSLEDPYLYTVESCIFANGKCVDKVSTPYGIRTIKWDIFGENPSNRFYLNDKPVFINGTAEYEHMFGQGHAFFYEQIKARVEQVKAMGYNAFRDGHQPHNLRYQNAWDRSGILWWPQMSAHIWFDNPEFRKNFKSLLTDWVKERRNSPSIILWGLENESTLPEGFAKECTELIRKLDPTTSTQRLVTTCNGGSGTDWNVIQNWSGTYGGDPENYANELSEQLLNGEYGAWRSIDLHTEGEFDQKGIYSEDRFNLLMESKIRLGEQAADKSCGQFHWLLTSHDNPGRTQSGEGLRDIDRVGPVNYKGALSIWGEPLDVFYLYRANYAPKETEPMVYIVSHTWPDRWTKPGIKSGIRLFTNCDEVELFNGLKTNSLGRKKRGPVGTHIVFNEVNIQQNMLYAVGYVNGKEVATDVVLVNHLPKAENIEDLSGDIQPLTNDAYNYLYRVNCGGGDYTDAAGNVWMADVHRTDEKSWGSKSWTDDYDGLPAFYGSQRSTNDPIKGTNEWPLIQTFRYGRHKLSYHFPLPDGKYKLELFFAEPWYGTGGGMNCDDWRVFDVSVNDQVVINDLDIWEEAGHDNLLKKTIDADISGGELKISFPQVKAGQAVISAIAISSANRALKPAKASERLISTLNGKNDEWQAKTWLTTGCRQFNNKQACFSSLAPELYATEWIQGPAVIKPSQALPSFVLSAKAQVFIGIDTCMAHQPGWLKNWVPLEKYLTTTFNESSTYQLYKKQFEKGVEVQLEKLSEAEFNMYPVMVAPATLLDDPIDLRETTTWQAEDGKALGAARIISHLEKECLYTPGSRGTMGVIFQVGLASKYGLHFRYINLSGDELNADVKIIAADGRVMWAGEWTFPATPDKWKSYRTDTQTTINAGTYTIEITPKGEGDFYVDWLKVQ
ncbi:malectin domain-containing carbohydrate-binding protein [uncultured Draconibacterium sp.]|uniref:malectin domain-containing carbohydrate-binding protein n=1 Tax=uncultured Draconibacterium sp. TaxID=1573823 RepID=UPI0025EC6433|nr:malectin domain-containing carbohydrate-binding protein [uncultured Draconibacterium sp.]